MRTLTLLCAISAAATLGGCSIINSIFNSILPQPDVFYLNRWNISGQLAVVHNLSPIDSVRQTADNTLYLHSGSTVAISTDKITDFAGDFSVTLPRGGGIRLAFRTVEHFYETEKGIAFVFTTNGSYIEENGREIARIDTIRAVPGLQTRIFIINEGRKYRVQAGCNVIYRGETDLPTTEYIIAVPLPNSDAELAGIDMYPIRGGRPVDYNREKPWGHESGMSEIYEERAKRLR